MIDSLPNSGATFAQQWRHVEQVWSWWHTLSVLCAFAVIVAVSIAVAHALTQPIQDSGETRTNGSAGEKGARDPLARSEATASGESAESEPQGIG